MEPESDTEREWAERIDALAALMPLFEGGTSESDEAIRTLIDVANGFGWVLSDFDWSKWTKSEEFRTLVESLENIREIDRLMLARLLTVFLRQERFCEGSLSDAFRGGYLTEIVRRASTLAVKRTH